MSDAFSTPADHALSHPELEAILENAQAGPSSIGDGAEEMSIEEAFEVDETVRRVLEGDYKTVSSETYIWKSRFPRNINVWWLRRKWNVMHDQSIADKCLLQIGLQFPDELLPSSVSVYRAIQTRIAHTGAQAYVLADSTYGKSVVSSVVTWNEANTIESCCPDVLSCLHLPADFLVHYGHACLTP